MRRGTFRPLAAVSVPSRHPLVPAQPSRFTDGMGCSCQSEEGRLICSLIGRMDVNDWLVFILQICDVAGLFGAINLMAKRSPGNNVLPILNPQLLLALDTSF